MGGRWWAVGADIRGIDDAIGSEEVPPPKQQTNSTNTHAQKSGHRKKPGDVGF